MALLTITEYAKIELDDRGYPVHDAPRDPPIKRKRIDFTGETGSGKVSAVFDAQTKFVRIDTDTAAQIEIGESPSCDEDSRLLPANTVEKFGVVGGTHALAVRVAAT